MKKSGHSKVCPECGRTLETTINRFRVEMWPAHKVAASADRSMDWPKNEHLPVGLRDDEVQCFNSAQPV